MSVRNEAGDVARVIITTRALRLLICIEDLHADHVVLDVCAAVDQAGLVVIVVTRWIGVAEDDALHRHATRGAEVENLIAVPEPGGHVDLHGEMRLALCDACGGE